MIFDHRYKYKYHVYEAGEDVPIEDETVRAEDESVPVPEAEEKPKRRGRPKKE